MSAESKAFEQRIHRLHELLEGSDATVTWNDRIDDPDNPEQRRQIDVTIRRDGTLTLVECRIHKEPQDVTWIEELMGRRTSLQASAAIAVSASGFTEGARRKAQRHGIFLRELDALSPAEIESWGIKLLMTVYYYQYENLQLVLVFRPDSIARIHDASLATEIKTNLPRRALFNAVADQLEPLKLLPNEKMHGVGVEFQVRGTSNGFCVCGEQVKAVELTGAARLITQPIALPAILGYEDPNQQAATRNVVVQKDQISETGFIVADGKRIATILDLNGLKLPPNCQFKYLRTTANEEMDMDSFELLGLEQLDVSAGPMTVDIVSETP